MISKRAFLSAVATVGTGTVFGYRPWPARAEAYPSRPIKIVVAFAAGGPLDFVSRLIAEKMSASLKEPVIIDNRGGAGGNIGGAVVAKAPPDGYTLLITLNTALTVNPLLYSDMPFDPRKDLRPISILASDSQMLVVHPSVPVNNVAEFVAMAKKQPVTYAGAGFGSPGHLTMSYFAMKAGFHGTLVPFKGNAPLVTALLGGQIKTAFVSTAGVLPHVRAGQLKGLAISAAQRSPLAPNIPTIAESGYPGFKVLTEFVLLAPAAIPDPIADSLESVVRGALRAPDVAQKIAAENIQIVGSTAIEARQRLGEDAALWKSVVKDTGMKAG
jgi:tripartite-type tricarboxylate transporter receptor subunit TctC